MTEEEKKQRYKDWEERQEREIDFLTKEGHFTEEQAKLLQVYIALRGTDFL